MDASFETGFLPFLNLKVHEVILLDAKQRVEVYETLENFVTDISRKVSPNVKLDNIKNLFYFVVFLIFVLFVFLIDTFLLKKLKVIKRKLTRLLINWWRGGLHLFRQFQRISRLFRRDRS